MAIAFSVSLHFTVVAIGAGVVRHELASRYPEPQTVVAVASRSNDPIDIEVPPFSSSGIAQPGPAPTDQSEAPHPGGLDSLPRPDTDRAGRGGTDTASKPAVNLADRDDAIRLSPEMQSRIDRDQIQRLATAHERKSWEDGRYTTNPMELTFLASGNGRRMERRDPAESDPSRGVNDAPPASLRGRLRIGAAPVPLGYGLAPSAEGGQPGGSTSSPGKGVLNGAPGQDHRSSAAVASARPLVRQGSPSVPANEPGRPKDTVNANQEVASAMQSILHASAAGGKPGEGPGGSNGPGATGSGGLHGPGSRSEAMGSGGGGYYAPDQRDARLTEYQRKMAAKLYPLWENAFPRWAILDLRQGTVIVSFTVLADGSVANPFIRRPSGIAEFDAKCLEAVRRASPFERLPANLNVQRMQWEMSFEASNPIVR
ncbi:MAG: TonB C-terminal domain-containing protein [Deltaproteobacteria bacterium]|nr:TonB C-terminal domain-containing protein [Deltaproteobacteria bacterium]